jgi:hypothetical protein
MFEPCEYCTGCHALTVEARARFAAGRGDPGEGSGRGSGTQLLLPLRPCSNASELLKEAEPVKLDPVIY